MICVQIAMLLRSGLQTAVLGNWEAGTANECMQSDSRVVDVPRESRSARRTRCERRFGNDDIFHLLGDCLSHEALRAKVAVELDIQIGSERSAALRTIGIRQIGIWSGAWRR